jgi:tetratricopeptide (TPR) repeat protein
LIDFFLFPQALPAPVNRLAEAKQILSKAVEAYDREDFGAAKTGVSLALEAEPNFAEAHILRALLQYRDGKMEEAEASLKRALDLNPRLPDQVRERLEKEAHQIEGALTYQDFSHFRLQFHGGERRDKAWEAVKHLDAVYNYMGSRFGVFPPDRIPVIIFTSEEFWEAWSAPFWLGGFFDMRDGKIRVRLDEPPGGEQEMIRRLRHEFTHAFFYQLYPKELPLWFQEGIAEFYAYANPTNSFWKEIRLEELRKETKGAPWLEMAKIQDVIEKKNVAPGYIYLAYLESAALALYIGKERGDSWIPSVVQRLRAGKTFDQAFLDVVGIPPGRMMEQLRRSWD